MFHFHSWMPRVLPFLLWAVLIPCFGLCQQNLKEVQGLPTKEVFDLLVDRKGFLWVGHDMGISRFDGTSFTHFSHPQRSSLSITDLIEDPQGRIWFHNFTGQVFYIENERMHLVDAYQNEEEAYFPRMVLYGNEIVVTSRRGLFICDTRILKCRYEKVAVEPNSPTRSVTVIGNKVLALNINHWYVYDSIHGLRPTELLHPQALAVNNRHLALQPQPKGDSAFLIANPSATVYQLTLVNNKVNMVNKLHVPNFINAVQREGGSIWVHGKEISIHSKEDKQLETISGNNISDMAVDHQKNRWFSTLNKGLLIEENNEQLQHFSFPFLAANDRVMAMVNNSDTLLIGTSSGKLYEVRAGSSKLLGQFQLPEDAGSINLIAPKVDGKAIISTSVGTFLFLPAKKKIIPYLSFISKELAIYKDRILIASATGLYSLPFATTLSKHGNKQVKDLNQWNQWWQNFRAGRKEENTNNYYWYLPRCRSIALTSDQELYVSFMNGVFAFEKNGVKRLFFKGEKVYSNSMLTLGRKLYIGTFNNGLIIKEGKTLKKIAFGNGLFSNSVVKLKRDQHFLWIMQDRGIQLLDLRTDSIVDNIELPQEPGPNIYDVASWNEATLLATSSGMYKVVMKPSERYKTLKSFLNLVVVNRKDSISGSGVKLGYNQSDIQFHLSVPWYDPANNLYFKYRLKSESPEGQWYTTQPGERTIRYASLMPGIYTFEAYAVVAGFQEKNPVTFQFTIAKPWWKTTGFTLALICAVALLFYGLYLMRVRQVLRLEQVRQSISSDLHDEIGSTISSINIYSELAKSESNNGQYLDLIQENTRDVITKLDDLVWSINPKNDSVFQLAGRMRSFAEPVLAGAGIHLQFCISEEVNHLELTLAKKRNLYLAFKELVNNVVKHSRARNCFIDLQLRAQYLWLTVRDDGVGIDETKIAAGRSGMQNLMARASQTKANFFIAKVETGGTKAVIQLPIK